MNLTKNKGAANTFVQALDVAAIPQPPAAAPVAVKTSLLNLSDLWVTPEYQVSRDYTDGQVFDPEWARELAHLLSDEDKELDPVDVFILDGKSTLVHGYSRYGAYTYAGRRVIPAIIHPGGPDEAMELALRCNARPVKPQSNSDKEKRVRTAFAFFASKGLTLSEREIARRLDGAVSHTFVGIVRRKLEAEVAAAAAERGEEPPAKPETVTTTRGGQTYTMNTAGLKNRSHKLQKATSVPPAPVAPVAPSQNGASAPVAAPWAKPAAAPTLPPRTEPTAIPSPSWAEPQAKPLVQLADEDTVIGTLTVTAEQARLLLTLLAEDDSYAACGLKDQLGSLNY